MSIVGTAGEMRDSPEGNFELGKWTVIRRFKVLTDDINDGPIIVTGAIGIPLLYQTYQFGFEGFPLMRCRSIVPRRDANSPLLWIIECTYETAEQKGFASGGNTDENAGGGTGTEQDKDYENPLFELPDIVFALERRETPILNVYDLDTQKVVPLKNAAGEVFDPPPEKMTGILTLNISRNEPVTAPHPFLGVYYQDAVNSDNWGWGLTAGQARCDSIIAGRQVRQLPNGVPFPYLRVSYNFTLKPDWDLYVLNAGHYYLKQARSFDPSKNVDVPNVKFLTDDGHPRVGLLTIDGTKLPDGAPPVYIQYRPYRRLPFGLLNLPSSFVSGVQ